MHTDEFPICITLVSPTYTSLSLSLITSSLTTSRRKKGIIIKNNNNTYSPHLHHFIFPLYTYIHTYIRTQTNGFGKRIGATISFFPARFISHRSMHLSTPSPQKKKKEREKERKKEERDTVQRTGAFLEIGFPRRQWRRRRRPEIERSQSPLLRSKCREKTGSRLFLQSAVDWIGRRPFLRLRRTERERERGEESMCDTRGSLLAALFLLFCSSPPLRARRIRFSNATSQLASFGQRKPNRRSLWILALSPLFFRAVFRRQTIFNEPERSRSYSRSGKWNLINRI